jgi:hypothetical protein
MEECNDTPIVTKTVNEFTIEENNDQLSELPSATQPAGSLQDRLRNKVWFCVLLKFYSEVINLVSIIGLESSLSCIRGAESTDTFN